jgi:hypothetical protein
VKSGIPSRNVAFSEHWGSKMKANKKFFKKTLIYLPVMSERGLVINIMTEYYWRHSKPHANPPKSRKLDPEMRFRQYGTYLLYAV